MQKVVGRKSRTLTQTSQATSIPTLRDDSGWITEPNLRANVFASTFSAKATLPAEVVDTPFFGIDKEEQFDWFPFRSRACKRFFKLLNKNKATGSDTNSAHILKMLADCLAASFTKVIRRFLHAGCPYTPCMRACTNTSYFPSPVRSCPAPSENVARWPRLQCVATHVLGNCYFGVCVCAWQIRCDCMAYICMATAV